MDENLLLPLPPLSPSPSPSPFLLCFAVGMGGREDVILMRILMRSQELSSGCHD